MPMLSPWKPATLCFLGAITACGSTGPDDDFDGVTINMTAGLLFAPADVTIDPGTRVRWVSAAAILHTITPNTPGQPGVWAAVNTSQAGTVLTHTFAVAGQTYTYACQIHVAEGMTGVIRVR
jgi:plastocyanin